MAKPLRAFRKYQKQMLVFFGVLLMIAFVLGGVLTSLPSYTGGGGNGEPRDTIAVQWDGKKYSEDELAAFLDRHLLAQQFLFQLVAQANAVEAIPRTDPQLLPVSNDRDGGIRDAANILLLADEAQRMGFVVTEDVVDNYLNRVCDSAFSEIDYIELLKTTTGGRMTLPRLKEHLKAELAALRLQDVMFSGMGSLGGNSTQFGVVSLPPEPFVTPVSAVASQKRINNKATIQFYPVEVAPFVDKVTEKPSRRELRALYDRGAVRFPDFAKRTPGFRVPDRAVVQWFQIGQDDFLPPKESITEEAIKAEYDKRVAAKDLSVLATPEPAGGAGGGEGEGADPSPMDPENGTGEGGTETEGSESESTESENTESDNTEEAGSGEESTGNEDGDGNVPQSSIPVSGRETFVSLPTAQEEEGNSEEANSSQDETGESETTDPQESGDDTSQEQTPPPNSSEGESQETGEEGTEPAADEPQFKPLEEVRDSIIDSLRRQAAGEKRNQSLEEIMEKLDAYFVDHEVWEAEKIEEPGLPAPAAPNFEEMAETYGIGFGSTEELVNFVEFSETQVGQAFAELPRNQMNFQNFPNVAQVLFEQFRSNKPYQPRMTILRDYIYWVSEQDFQHVPSFDEAEEDIERFWKWDAAIALATAEAESKLSGSGSLVDEHPGVAFESQPFSWLSVGGGNVAMGGGQLSLSNINYSKKNDQGEEELASLEGIGNEFMKTVFDLNVGESGTAADATRDNVYAIQVVAKEDSSELAETAVKNQQQPSMDARRIVGTDIAEYRNDWVNDLQERRNMRWSVKKAN